MASLRTRVSHPWLCSPHTECSGACRPLHRPGRSHRIPLTLLPRYTLLLEATLPSSLLPLMSFLVCHVECSECNCDFTLSSSPFAGRVLPPPRWVLRGTGRGLSPWPLQRGSRRTPKRVVASFLMMWLHLMVFLNISDVLLCLTPLSLESSVGRSGVDSADSPPCLPAAPFPVLT